MRKLIDRYLIIAFVLVWTSLLLAVWLMSGV